MQFDNKQSMLFNSMGRVLASRAFTNATCGGVKFFLKAFFRAREIMSLDKFTTSVNDNAKSKIIDAHLTCPIQ